MDQARNAKDLNKLKKELAEISAMLDGLRASLAEQVRELFTLSLKPKIHQWCQVSCLTPMF